MGEDIFKGWFVPWRTAWLDVWVLSDGVEDTPLQKNVLINLYQFDCDFSGYNSLDK